MHYRTRPAHHPPSRLAEPIYGTPDTPSQVFAVSPAPAPPLQVSLPLPPIIESLPALPRECPAVTTAQRIVRSVTGEQVVE